MPTDEKATGAEQKSREDPGDAQTEKKHARTNGGGRHKGNGTGDSNGTSRSKADDMRAEAEAAWSSEEPLPLFPSVGIAAPYPVSELGPLQPVVKAIANVADVEPAMAAASVLAAASLATMGHRRVMTPYDLTIPLALYLLTIAKSGDRKTSADSFAMRGIREYEAHLRQQWVTQNLNFSAHLKAWEVELAKIIREKNLGMSQRTLRIQQLGSKPVKPPEPKITSSDMTLEALAKFWRDLPPIHALFSSEGGLITAGAAMRDELLLSTVASLSDLWDGAGFNRMRASYDQLVSLPDRLLALHAMIQPTYVAGLVDNPRIKGQGFTARLLVAWPPSRLGERPWHDPGPADMAEIEKFAKLVLKLLRKPMAIADTGGVKGQPMPLSPKAKDLWIGFYDCINALTGTLYEPVAATAAKAAEQAMRIAGVLETISKADPKQISPERMRNGIALAEWYLDEALRIEMMTHTENALADAQELLDWLRRDGACRTLRGVMRGAPRSRFRKKSSAQSLLSILEEHGWLRWTERKGRSKSFEISGFYDA